MYIFRKQISFFSEKEMDYLSIKGNMFQLPRVHYMGENVSNLLQSWVIEDIGEAIGFWALHKSRFWRIVKPLLLKYIVGDEIVTFSSFISPNQIRTGVCLLPNEDEIYYKEMILTEEQVKATHGWDFLALQIEKIDERFEAHPSLIDIKTQRSIPTINKQHKKRPTNHDTFAREKKQDFKVFLLQIIFQDNWHFEVKLEEV